MSAIERPQDDVVERVATVTSLPARPVVEAPDPFVLLKQAARTFTPPDLWSDDRPSLRKMWLYAVHGRWTRTDGFARWAGVAWSIPAMAVTTAAYSVAWIFERPSRFAVAATVAGLVYLAF